MQYFCFKILQHSNINHKISYHILFFDSYNLLLYFIPKFLYPIVTFLLIFSIYLCCIGASTVARLGTKTTYYIMTALNALSKLSSTLRSSMKTMWRIARITTRITKYSFGNYSKFTISCSSVILLRLLPFLPPVLVGIYVLFSAFWPQRILFFSASQRRRFINRQKWHWIGFLLLLIFSLCINTVLINELQAALNNSLPFLHIHIKRKLGWKISVAASTFAMASAFSFLINYWILENYTYKNQDNIAFGPKIERKIK